MNRRRSRNPPPEAELFDHMCDDLLDHRTKSDIAADAARMSKVFFNSTLRGIAVELSNAHPVMCDYAAQAPIVVLYMCNGKSPSTKAERTYIRWRAYKIGETGPKLKEIFHRFQIPTAYRQFDARAVCLRDFDTLNYVRSRANPSTIAQAIPRTVTGQRLFLRALDYWRKQFRQQTSTSPTTEWAVREIGRLAQLPTSQRPKYGTVFEQMHDIRDFAHQGGLNFDPRQTWDQVLAGHDRWANDRNEEVARQRAKTLQIGWDTLIASGDLPTQCRIGQFEFHLCNSAELLYEEAVAMHNCVDSYLGSVRVSRCAIYSLRMNGKRIATIELVSNGRHVTDGILRTRQVRGITNKPLRHAGTLRTVAAFCAGMNKARTTDPTHPPRDLRSNFL